MKQGMIPIFIPHVGCPHICVFCNQHRIANTTTIPTGKDIEEQIQSYTKSSTDKRFWEIAFYGGSFTAIPKELQIELLTPAKKALDAGIIDAIRCSTRPDALSQEAIDLMIRYGMNTVEIGVQSMDDEVLKKSQRGHSAKDVVDAVQRLKENNFTIGLQLMPGLPGDTLETIKATTKSIAELNPDFVRIYPVLVIADTQLGDSYLVGEYKPLSKELAISYSAWMKTYFEERGIKVIRTGLQATETLDSGESLLAGPYSPSFGEEVINQQIVDKIRMILNDKNSFTNIHISYPRAFTSKVRGLKNNNKIMLEKEYKANWTWQEDNTLSVNTIKLMIDKICYTHQFFVKIK